MQYAKLFYGTDLIGWRARGEVSSRSSYPPPTLAQQAILLSEDQDGETRSLPNETGDLRGLAACEVWHKERWAPILSIGGL